MTKNFHLYKMKTDYTSVAQYYIKTNEADIYMNDKIGYPLEINYLNQIHCIRCGRQTKKSFGQGFCYPCFRDAPEASPCILKPELCKAHEGESRDMEWSKSHCLVHHYVYLSVTSGLKVGVTRENQIPTRWIDQGASKAVKIAKTPNRHLAGLIEVALKEHYSDRTQWQKMLKNITDYHEDLNSEKKKVRSLLPQDHSDYYIDEEIESFEYPVLEYPSKVKSLGLDKTNAYKGVLKGIKGQYLIFDEGIVFNVRKHNGYMIQLSL